MKYIVKEIVAIISFSTMAFAHTGQTTPYYSIRSQGVDAARELAGWTQHINLFDMDKVYGSLSVTTEYSQSFNPRSIAQSLFGTALICPSKCSESIINVSGSRIQKIGIHDLLADNFYLPTDYQGQLSFKPTIANVVADIHFYVGLDEWFNGLFFRIDLPINWTRWNLNFTENLLHEGQNDYDAGYFNGYDVAPTADNLGGIGVENRKLNRTFASYARGVAPVGVATYTGQATETLYGLRYGQIDCGARSVTRLADVECMFGWNFINDEAYHVGAALLVRAPTGNRPDGRYLFEPISGNGGSWEVGAHITSHATFWRSETEEESIGIFVDTNITHLFAAKQTRTFDLKNKPLSRYMLATQNTDAVRNLIGINTTTISQIPAYQFANAFTPVANISTQELEVTVGFQADLVAQLTYVNSGLNVDLGYNFWVRSPEKFRMNTDCLATNTQCLPYTSCNQCPNTFSPNTFGLKGDAFVYGFNAATLIPVALSATENEATIENGTNAPDHALNPSDILAAQVNPSIDNPGLAYQGIGGAPLNDQLFVGYPQINTSVQPILIDHCDFNMVGTRGMSHKVYTHISYNWIELEDWVPYVGMGAYGEFGQTKNRCQNNLGTSCSGPCTSHASYTSLSQWGIWIKGGVSFN